jgi:alpha-tubulin suppressor-like RCC1 family protein
MRWSLFACAATGVLAGCSQDALVAPKAAHTPPYLAVAISCTANITQRQTTCGQLATGTGATTREAFTAVQRAEAARLTTPSAGVRSDVAIIGGQGVYVLINWTNSTLSGSTYSQTATVQDLTTQPFGTTDGVTADPLGIEVFFDSLPTVTSGSGSVTVANGQRPTPFLSGQPAVPYFQYPGLLPSNATTAPVTWQFTFSGTVNQFQYLVYVVTRVPSSSVAAITNNSTHAFNLLAAGQTHSCALRPGSDLPGDFSYCWGFNIYGAVGTGNSTPVLLPIGTLGTHTFASIAGGAEFSCGVDGNHVPYCWGDNARGEIGDGTTTDRGTPTAVGGGFSFTQVVNGAEFACGLQSDGTAYCWGANSLGQLGDGTTTDRSAPSTGKPVGNVTFSSLAAGAFHVCGVATNANVYCWGGNTAGAIGQTPDSAAHPTPVAVTGHTFSVVVAGDNFSCGIAGDANVYCWGANLFGALGNGTMAGSSSLQAVSAPSGVTFVTLAAGAFHACGATASGATYCWGDNYYGQLGTGGTPGTSTSQELVPTPVAGGPYSFVALAAGFSHTCGITGADAAYCWGDNEVGQLGNGGTISSNIPVAVSLP